MRRSTGHMPDSIANGEEFRDDRRVRRALPPDVLRDLTRIDPVRSTLSVLTTLAVIVAAAAVALTWWEPWTVIPAVVVIATQQHACFVLAHDAAHYRLFRTRWLNDLVGRGVAIAPGVSMCTYRVVHRLHHNHLYEPGDPDIALHGGYPRGRACLLHVNYHVEHHLYPAIPHYNLPACHRELRARGILEGAEVRPWLETVRLVAADRPAVGA